MAFRQPTFAPPQRQSSTPIQDSSTPTILIPAHQRALEESQEWVLFSPTHDSSTVQTQTTSSQRTAGLSRLSDFGSLEKERNAGQSEEDVADATDDEEELDSLDDGLHAFRESSVYQASRRLDQSGGTILPTHDGLGTFPASSLPVQERIWQFEQYNPRKRSAGHHRRRSSVERRLYAVEKEDVAKIESERLERIEKWRAEQSKLLLEEIQQETRKRRMSRTNESMVNKAGREEQENTVMRPRRLSTGSDKNGPTTEVEGEEPEGSESFWERVTRRVIRDFMGIDESLLSVILGESLPEEEVFSTKIPNGLLESASPPLSRNAAFTSTGWEDRLLHRLARELGILVNQLSEHPGAFSTYLNPSTPDYAGIPISSQPSSQATPLHVAPPPLSGTASSISPHFTPTLQDRPETASASHHAALWGIEEEDPNLSIPLNDCDREYWEHTPTLKTIFRFLHHRFTSHRRPSSASTKPNIATSSTPDSLRRTAVIRQYHPLISRPSTYDRQSRRNSLVHAFHHRHSSSPILSTPPQFWRPESSCGSVSLRKSMRGGSGSSRNYWDLGVSVGSGSVHGGGMGGMGAWGEV
ncbi:hypothetical protein MMC12_006349 [Toensbergia leucococca]|nr:hypothetical protein [Toensbergia leucococca]